MLGGGCVPAGGGSSGRRLDGRRRACRAGAGAFRSCAARRRASTSVSATPSSAPNSSITTISVISGTPAEKSTKSTLTFFEFLITKPIT